MSESTTAPPQVEEAQATPTPAAPASTEPKPTESVAASDPAVAQGQVEQSKGGDEVTKPIEEQATMKPADEEAPTERPAAEQQPASEKKDESSTGDKVEDMVAEKTEPEAEKVADENAEVKMETSTTEEKADEKVNEVPNNTSEQPTSQPPASQTTPAPQQAEENKEAAEVKPLQVTNEQPQPPKQPQSTLPTRQYLDATVVPILHSALSQLAKVRPEDPIQYLCTYLSEYKDNFTSDQK